MELARFETIRDFYIPVRFREECDAMIEKWQSSLTSQYNQISVLRDLPLMYVPHPSKDGDGFVPLTYLNYRISVSIAGNGYRYAGIIVKDNSGVNRLTSFGGRTVDIPPYFKHCDFSCDKCKHIGTRKYLYIVQNSQTGWYSKIGTECLDEIVKTHILKDIKNTDKLFDALIELEKENHSNFKETVPIDLILRLSIDLINHKGYVSKAEAQTQNSKSTADIVKDIIKSGPQAEHQVRLLGISNPYDKCSPELNEQVQKIIRKYSSDKAPCRTDYDKKVSALFKYKSVYPSQIGLIVSTCKHIS